MAEFALILPLLVILVTGIFEFGIAFNRAQAIEAAAREGARLASLSSTGLLDIQTRVDEALAGLPIDNLEIQVLPPWPEPCAGRQGEAVKVVVSADHLIEVPFVLERTVPLTGEAVFRCEA